MEKTYGKWGMLRKTYLTNHKTELLKSLIANEELISHLNEIDEQANICRALQGESLILSQV